MPHVAVEVDHADKLTQLFASFWNCEGLNCLDFLWYGFCVSVGIIAMHNFGVYGQSLIKKRRYWPKNVPGEAISSYFANKELGSAKTFRQVFDGKPLLVHCHKDDRYVTKTMSIHGLRN